MPRPTKQERVYFDIRIPVELKARLEEAATERGLSRNKLVVWSIELFLDQLPPVEQLRQR